MDGVPIFNLVRETLPAVDDAAASAASSTARPNFILTAMEAGTAVRGGAAPRCRRAGVAEADASLDVDGWDAAAKTAALANVLLGANITPKDVERQGIGPDTWTAARCEARRGRAAG